MYNDFEVKIMFIEDNNVIPLHATKQRWIQQYYHYSKTPRPYSGLMIIAKGHAEFITKNETFTARPGDIIFLPKDSYYDVLFHTESKPVVNYLANFVSDKEIWDSSVPLKIAENTLPNCLEPFRNYVRENLNPELSMFYRKGLLYILLDTVLQETNGMLQQNTYILEKAKNYIHANPNCSISEISKQYGISESGFRKLFKDKFGISPVQYRKTAKIFQATYLLESSTLSISEIADELGFCDTAYFYKCFQEHTGMTPKEYLQNRRI